MCTVHVLSLCVKEVDMPIDWDLSSGSTFLNYQYPPLPSVKFQLLYVRMLGQLIVHGVCYAAVSVCNRTINKLEVAP